MKHPGTAHRPHPDPEIVAYAESNDPGCGKEFKPGLCRTRYLAAKVREALGLEYGLCAYCPLILRHLGVVTKSADSDTPTCTTCGNALTKNGFCHSCRSTEQQAKEVEKRPLCKTCGKVRVKDGFEYCSYCLKRYGRTKFKTKLEESKPMETKPATKKTKKTASKPRSSTCKQCGKPCTFNESGLCRPCGAARNAKRARESKPLCNKTAPKVTQGKSNVTLDIPGVGTCPEPATDTIHAAKLPGPEEYVLANPPRPSADLYRQALQRWGDRNQIAKAAEEASELSAAILRYLSPGSWESGKNMQLAVIEELADVEIMLKQMRLVFGDQPIDAAKRQKLERLEGRLEE